MPRLEESQDPGPEMFRRSTLFMPEILKKGRIL